jgi:hypothetical protein
MQLVDFTFPNHRSIPSHTKLFSTSASFMKGGLKRPSTSIHVIRTASAETSLRWPCSARRLRVTAIREYLKSCSTKIGIHTEEF